MSGGKNYSRNPHVKASEGTQRKFSTIKSKNDVGKWLFGVCVAENWNNLPPESVNARGLFQKNNRSNVAPADPPFPAITLWHCSYPPPPSHFLVLYKCMTMHQLVVYKWVITRCWTNKDIWFEARPRSINDVTSTQLICTHTLSKGIDIRPDCWRKRDYPANSRWIIVLHYHQPTLNCSVAWLQDSNVRVDEDTSTQLICTQVHEHYSSC